MSHPDENWRPQFRVEKLITKNKPRMRRDETFPSRNFHFSPNVDHWPLRKREVLGPYEMRWGWTARRIIDGWWENGSGVRYRYFFGSIQTGGVQVGAVELHEYDCAEGLSRRDFFDTMDLVSMQTYELARVICSTFNEDEFDVVIGLGSILYWNTVWMHPDHAHGAVWARLTNPVIERMRGWSILITKAFPLEYQNGGSVKAFRHRQDAMFRYYKQLLKVEPIQRRRHHFYGTPEKGWMLRWHPRVVEIDDTGKTAPVRFGISK